MFYKALLEVLGPRIDNFPNDVFKCAKLFTFEAAELTEENFFPNKTISILGWFWARPRCLHFPNPIWAEKATHNYASLLPGAELMSEGDYTDKWPNMARNSESGPGAELWRFRLFGIESRLAAGKVRISNDSPGVVKLFSPMMSEKKFFFFWGIIPGILCGWMENKLGFLPRVLWKPPAEIQLHPVSGLHNLERVPPPLFTYIPTHPNCYTTYSTRRVFT